MQAERSVIFYMKKLRFSKTRDPTSYRIYDPNLSDLFENNKNFIKN